MSEIIQQPVVAVVLLIGILVFVHEFGHYIVGKFFGFGIEIFSIGFGPRLIGFTHKKTDYRISLIPLGGYVKFAGALASEPVADEFKGMEIYKKPIWQRALMTFAGPFANLLLAIAAYTYLGSSGIEHRAPVVGQVRADSPAFAAGLEPGDRILEIEKRPIQKWTEMVSTISESAGKEVNLVVRRGDQTREVIVTPSEEMIEGLDGKKKSVGRIGISDGYLPSQITLSASSPLAGMGMKNGDTVKRVSDGRGQFYDVETYHEFLRALGAIVKSGNTRIILSYESVTESTSLSEEALSNQSGAAEQDSDMAREEASVSELKSITANVDELATIAEQNLTEYLTGLEAVKILGIKDGTLTVATVESTAENAIQVGDTLLSVEGQELGDVFDLQYFLMDNKTPSVSMQLMRAGQRIDVSVDLKPIEIQKAAGKDVFYAFPGKFFGKRVLEKPYVEKYDGVFSAFVYGVKHSLAQSAMIVGALFGLITGDVPLGALGGPMLIAKVAGDSAALGLAAYLSTLAIISINLCMINLFPIPVLDGGQLVMLGAEAVKGRRLSEAAIENYQKVGFVMVMGLVILSTYNDLGRFWASMIRGVSGQ